MRFIDCWTDKIEIPIRFGFAEELNKAREDDDDNDDDDDELSEQEKEQHLAVLDLFALPDEMCAYMYFFFLFVTIY